MEGWAWQGQHSTHSPPLQHHKGFQEKGQAHGAALGKIKATTVMSKSHESSVFSKVLFMHFML